MKQRRLHQAISEASELRAFIVLTFIACLRAWRWIQFAWHIAPDVPDLLIERWRYYVNKWLTYYLYDQVHWIRE